MKLKEMLEVMHEYMDRYDLGDEYLEKLGSQPGDIGEWTYGVSMVPCAWVYPYLEAMASDERFTDVVERIEGGCNYE